jgi:hypothetical protein
MDNCVGDLATGRAPRTSRRFINCTLRRWVCVVTFALYPRQDPAKTRTSPLGTPARSSDSIHQTPSAGAAASRTRSNSRTFIRRGPDNIQCFPLQFRPCHSFVANTGLKAARRWPSRLRRPNYSIATTAPSDTRIYYQCICRRQIRAQTGGRRHSSEHGRCTCPNSTGATGSLSGFASHEACVQQDSLTPEHSITWIQPVRVRFAEGSSWAPLAAPQKRSCCLQGWSVSAPKS